MGQLAEGGTLYVVSSELSYLCDLEEHIGWGQILKSSYGSKPEKDGTIFYGGS